MKLMELGPEEWRDGWYLGWFVNLMKIQENDSRPELGYLGTQQIILL